MKVKNSGESRIALMSEIYTIMAITNKQLRQWNKTAAPHKIDRESLLIDTLISKGWRLVDFPDKEPEQ